MSKQKPRLEHYLITIYPTPYTHLHGYVMTDDKRVVQDTISRMVDMAEEVAPLYLPVVLSTTLDTGVGLVREIIARNSEEAKKCLASATDFHLSIFAMQADCPDDKQLMELH